jgi:DnaJ family protein C protein 17
MHAKKVVPGFDSKKESGGSGGGGGGGGVDQEKVLKVSWEKIGEDYSADKLRELFSKFGEVEDVVIKGNKKKGSALVVMATKQGAVSFLFHF